MHIHSDGTAYFQSICS